MSSNGSARERIATRIASRVSIRVLLVLLVLLVCGLPLAAFATQDTTREFTNAERVSLAQGSLVERPLSQRRGSLELMGGTSYQVIDAAPDVVWRGLLDTKQYHHMMPQVLEARLVRASASQRTVFVRQGAGPIEANYFLKLSIHEQQHDITFTIDDQRPHDLRAAWGFYTVRSYDEGRKTLLAYGVMADIGSGMVVSLVRGQVHAWMLKVPWTIKRFVEGRGKKLYEAGTALTSAPARF